MNTSFTVVILWRRVDNLGALGRIGGGICAHTDLFDDGFGVWGDARVHQQCSGSLDMTDADSCEHLLHTSDLTT